jgi:alpha-glucosidase
MVWEQSNSTAGFSDGKPWLPVESEHLSRAVAIQDQDPTALLHHYRRAIAFRTANPALSKGALTAMRANNDVLSFVRTKGPEEIFCAFNLRDAPGSVTLPEGNWQQIGAELGSAAISATNIVNLQPWQPCLARRV